MEYKVRMPVKLPRLRKYTISIRKFNDEESMNIGRECGAVQAGNWPEEGISTVLSINVRAKNLVTALGNFLANPKKHFYAWDKRNEVIAICENGSGKYEFDCNCDIFKNDRYGNDKGMKRLKHTITKA